MSHQWGCHCVHCVHTGLYWAHFPHGKDLDKNLDISSIHSVVLLRKKQRLNYTASPFGESKASGQELCQISTPANGYYLSLGRREGCKNQGVRAEGGLCLCHVWSSGLLFPLVPSIPSRVLPLFLPSTAPCTVCLPWSPGFGCPLWFASLPSPPARLDF